MSKKVITTYVCDLCGEEFTDPDDVMRVLMPAMLQHISEIAVVERDLCPKCLDRVTVVELNTTFGKNLRMRKKWGES